MSSEASDPTDPVPLTALVVAGEPLGSAIAAELQMGLGDLVDVEVVSDTDAAVAAAHRRVTGRIPLVVVTTGSGAPDDVLEALDTAGVLREARVLLVTDRDEHDDVASAIDHERLHAVVAIPWTAGTLAWHARSQLARQLRSTTPDDPRTASLLDADQRSIELPSSELLRDLELGPAQVTVRLVAAIERVLGPRPRLRLPAGTRLTHQDRSVDAVFVVLDGSVALDRHTAVGDLRLHHDSTGPVIGLLALAQQRRAFFTARSTSDVEVVHLSLEQLDRALRSEPEVGDALAAGAIRALARRLRRAEQLQIEKSELNRELDAERQRLHDALHELERARLDLVEQARFATLGELAAGVAHELNNPIAAIERAVSYLAHDLDRVLRTHPQAKLVRHALAAGRDRPPQSTAEERRLKRILQEAVGDRALAGRLHAAGIDDPAQARALIAAGADALELTEAAAGIGGAVHNLGVASERVGELVASLRGFARPDSAPVDGIDVHAVIEDAVRLTAHRLEGVTVERDFGSVPAIRGHPGPLGQVWINLLVNAAESLHGDGRIEIVTDAPDDDHIRVRIVDDGPGVDPEVLPRVFEPRFTTKHGTVRYGLGLGLAITRRIVEQHGGAVTLASRPGRTVATVVLPVRGTDPDERHDDAGRR